MNSKESKNSAISQPERLFLLDGMALAYRAYFAFIQRPLINSKGMNTSAIYGFTTTLMKLLEDEKPEHIAVVFDTKEPTFRHEMFKEYKATREKMPEDMSSQLGLLKDVVRAFKVPVIEQPGYEADDVIGTLAKRAEKEKVVTYMVTGDKDFMQLISPYIKILRPGKGGDEPEVVDEKDVLEKFGVAPEKVIDVLGLIGDKSDNVPGVPGIGEKTAIPLVQQYGGIEGLYEKVETIPQRGVREKLIKNKELAFLSKKLVTIHTDVPVPINFHELKANSPDTSALAKLFGELEFRSLANKFASIVTTAIEKNARQAASEKETTQPAAQRSVTDINSDKHNYRCVQTMKEFDELCARLRNAASIVFDTETTSNDALQADLVGLAFAVKEREAFYVPVSSEVGDQRSEVRDLFSQPEPESDKPTRISAGLPLGSVLEKLKPILANPSIKKVGQNIKYDMLVMKSYGIEVAGVAFDTMVASYILRADGQHSLDAMAMEHLTYRMIAFEDLVGKGRSLKHITEVPLDAITNYSAEDADMTLRISNIQKAKLQQLEQLKLCEEVDFPLIPVLARMEAEGIALDVPYLAEMSKDLERQINNLIRDIYTDAGGQFNINSTQQLGDILFNKLKLPTIRKTKTGFSTDVNVLEALRGQHPIIEKMLNYRQLTKLKSTYVDALPSLINPKTGRLHTSFNQTVALTGRLSSADPNLQNIPIRTEAGRAIRKAFVPGKKSNLILSADYSQIELRVMAHISGDEGLLEAFRNKEDIHASTSAKVFGVKPDDVTRDMRRKAKEVNFGIMYGIGPFGLANRLEISQSEAKEIIQRYFDRFPKVKQYINDTIDAARRKGYVSTLLGRRRYLPDVNSRNFTIRSNAERQAINMPIQGSSADMIKIAMIRIDEALRKSEVRSTMLLQVHDELVFEVPEGEVKMMKKLVVDRMENA
ncbi:MAG: DNA polymerase I, partial [Bacteroidetes bacterium]|nr:DNA polymerase I [Bacteroidota bacterium]